MPCFLSSPPSKSCVCLLCWEPAAKKLHCLPLEAAEEEPPPSTLISYCYLKCHGLRGSLGGLQWREEIILLSFCFVCAASGIQVLTRPGHISTAIVQGISGANCMLSGSRQTLQSWLAGQRKALLCGEKCLETVSLYWVSSAQLFVVVAVFL